MPVKLWKFIDNLGSFTSQEAKNFKTLYFPLANERIMSSISPDLNGDIKSGNNSFLLTPVSRIDLINLKSSRNFWAYIDKDRIWSATGVSKDIRQINKDKFSLEAGLLWQKITRENKRIGLKAEIVSFVPAANDAVEIMQVRFTNISAKKLNFIPTAAIPMYARSADNLRDHRQVTSLLQRITLHKFGVIAKPTLLFDEAGHHPNKDVYFVLGFEQDLKPPQYLYPTQDMFCLDSGDLEAPGSIFNNILPDKACIQGREPMGGLRFKRVSLSPGKSRTYTLLMGICNKTSEINRIITKFNSPKKIASALNANKDFWAGKANLISLASKNRDFDNWLRWVSIQPELRRIFGCSFLPDFDYGKGGRGWRDLWQDCLSLILNSPEKVKPVLINNFSGVRIDGSNATIIGKKAGEFISDRNNISRTWMDHGIWPLMTLDLYLNETGDFGILFKEAPYFRNHEICRSKERDLNWKPGNGLQLKTKSGKIYKGTILEHLLIQNLVQFFNVGAHNYVRLEGADWNDGLDMAKERGESVAFSAMYAYNLNRLGELLLGLDKPTIKVAKELEVLFKEIDYGNVKEKQDLLNDYFSRTKFNVSGQMREINTAYLAANLIKKANWMAEHIRIGEWLRDGFFNGYYDNQSKRVEGKSKNSLRMMLASQVFPVMSEVANRGQIQEILRNVNKYLWDKKCQGIRLNSHFGEEKHDLGRAFSFVYGDKENGAIFSHMAVMYAHALYKRGFVNEGFQALNSLFNLAKETDKSKIYPGLPEYFNLEGRGMYSYLTGSASWFVLTLVTEAFGVKGSKGHLIIEPKLTKAQFSFGKTISLKRNFAGRVLNINFINRDKKDYHQYVIKKAFLDKIKIENEERRLVLRRETLLSLAKDKTHTIEITLS